jgi:hypothetical protein
MATDRDTPARSRFRTARGRRSWKRRPGSPASLHASAQVRLNDFTGRPLWWNTNGMMRACVRSHRRVYSWRRSRILRNAGVIGKERPSPVLVVAAAVPGGVQRLAADHAPSSTGSGAGEWYASLRRDEIAQGGGGGKDLLASLVSVLNVGFEQRAGLCHDRRSAESASWRCCTRCNPAHHRRDCRARGYAGRAEPHAAHVSAAEG